MAAMNSSAEIDGCSANSLEVLSVFAFFHPSLVDDFVGFFYKVDFLDIEDVTYDILNNVFPFTLTGKHLGQWLPCPLYLHF